MFTTLLTLFRISLIAFLSVGTLATLSQAVAIALGNPDLMILAGTSISDNAAILASLAGILAFLQLYTREGKQAAADQLE